MSRAQRRAQVEREDAALQVSQQCRLLAASRSSVYRPPAELGEVDRAIMALIDRQYLARPYYGSRRMAAWLATQGHVVNGKRVRRLMRLMGAGGDLPASEAHRTFDKVRQVDQGTIANNKHLGAVLAMIRDQQLRRWPERQNGPRRRDRCDTRLLRSGELLYELALAQ